MKRLSDALQALDSTRFLLLFGHGIDDSFLSASGHELNVFEALNKQLKKAGYRRIVYSALDRPIYFVDSESQQLCDDLIWASRSQDGSPDSAIQTGPFGQRIVIPNHAGGINLSTHAIGDTHAMRMIDQLMNDAPATRTAVVFDQFESYMRLIQDPRTLSTVVANWLKLPSNNPNRAIFLFSAGSHAELEQVAAQLPIPEFRTIIASRQQAASHKLQVQHIDGPGEDEIRALIKRTANEQFVSLPKGNLAAFARIVAAENAPLKLWSERFAQLNELSVEAVRQRGWISSTRSTQRAAIEDLRQMTGLDEVKNRIEEIAAWYAVRQPARPEDAPNLHMIFSGNPGTGKTTAARLMGEIYQDIGVLQKGHLVEVKAADLVADYVGGTAIKTNQMIDSAMDGVLFIDEAYALAEKDRGGFGAEALETLLTRMENERNRFVVVLAGYRDPIQRLIRSNPGLSRRFPSDNRFEFPDFSLAQLDEILAQMLQDRQLLADKAMRGLLLDVLQGMLDQKADNFGNGGEVRNLVESLERRCLSRIQSTHAAPPFQLQADDLSAEFASFLPKEVPTPEVLLQEVNQLIGLEPVKQWLKRLVARVQFDQARPNAKPDAHSRQYLRHLLFVGNPGTGKTTVARLVGQVYHALGLLRKGHIVEVSMPDLIAGYVGQTAGKVMEQVHNAIGGVLFIDEAYALVRSNAFFQGSYGQEVIDTLVKAIEDQRGKLLVIMAGYPQEMETLVRSNPGLRSRFAAPVHFPDFTPEQIAALFARLAATDELILDETMLNLAVTALLDRQVRDPQGFGNARDTIAFYEQMKDRLAERVVMQSTRRADGTLSMPEGWNLFQETDVTGEDITVVIQGQSSPDDPHEAPLKSWVLPRNAEE